MQQELNPVAEYLADHTKELAEMAKTARLDALAASWRWRNSKRAWWRDLLLYKWPLMLVHRRASQCPLNLRFERGPNNEARDRIQVASLRDLRQIF
jgi:hypothetical protein